MYGFLTATVLVEFPLASMPNDTAVHVMHLLAGHFFLVCN